MWIVDPTDTITSGLGIGEMMRGAVKWDLAAVEWDRWLESREMYT